jgi:hypothetical protein
VLIPPLGIATRRSTDILAVENPDVVAAIRFIRENCHRPIRVADVLTEVPVSRRCLEQKRRGRGKFVTEGARCALMKDERQHFLEEEWPKIAGRIQRLGFEPKELLDALDKIPPAPATSLKREEDPGEGDDRE